MHGNINNEWRVELSNRHAELNEKAEDENDEWKKELEPKCRGKTSAYEESVKLVEKIKIEHNDEKHNSKNKKRN